MDNYLPDTVKDKTCSILHLHFQYLKCISPNSTCQLLVFQLLITCSLLALVQIKTFFFSCRL